jgi:hypothetical protein
MIKYIIYLGLILIALSLMPSVASITLELTGSINDAYAHLDHTNTDYLTGWNSSIADNLYDTTDLYVGQFNSTGGGGAFVWYRTYLYFCLFYGVQYGMYLLWVDNHHSRGI